MAAGVATLLGVVVVVAVLGSIGVRRTTDGASAAVPPDRTTADRTRRVWKIFGISLAVLLVVAGLAVIAAIVLFMVGMSQLGSNK